MDLNILKCKTLLECKCKTDYELWDFRPVLKGEFQFSLKYKRYYLH